MPDKGYEYRKEWNAKNYKQLNVALPPDLAESFKAVCEAHGEPARQVIVRLISEFVESPVPTKKDDSEAYGTRGKRRKAAERVIVQIRDICDAEDGYMNSIPENLQRSVRYANAEKAVSLLTEAIEAMEESFVND